jgi:hypothetical protein
VRDGDISDVVAFRALEGHRGDEGRRLVAVLIGGSLAPGVRATRVRAGDVVGEGEVAAACVDEVTGYVL